MSNPQPAPDPTLQPSKGEAGVIAGILFAGVGLASTLIGVGLVLMLVRGGATNPPMTGNLLGLLGRSVVGALRLESTSLVEVGLMVLLLTPIVRVMVGLVASLLERDWSYVLIGLAVLALVLYGVLSGNAAT